MRAQGLPLNTIVLAVVAVIVLVVIVMIFVPTAGNLFGALAGTAPTGDQDICSMNCMMLQSNLLVQYPSQARGYNYCTAGCVGVVDCEISGFTLSDNHCNGGCDTDDGECPECCNANQCDSNHGCTISPDNCPAGVCTVVDGCRRCV